MNLVKCLGDFHATEVTESPTMCWTARKKKTKPANAEFRMSIKLQQLLLSHFSRVWLCATPSLGFSRQEHWSGLPMHKSEKWKWGLSVMSNSSWPHGLQPTRLLRPWDFPGNSTGVGCHCLLQVGSNSKYTNISSKKHLGSLDITSFIKNLS